MQNERMPIQLGMPKLSETQRLEQGLTLIRLFGVVFAVAAIVTTSGWPDLATERLAWITAVFFALGSMTIWGASARLSSQLDQKRLGFIAFTFDVLIICSMIWIFAWDTPYLVWALLILVPLEGSMRYRLPGALLAGVLAAAFFIPQSLHRSDLTGETFQVDHLYLRRGSHGPDGGEHRHHGGELENPEGRIRAAGTQACRGRPHQGPLPRDHLARIQGAAHRDHHGRRHRQ